MFGLWCPYARARGLNVGTPLTNSAEKGKADAGQASGRRAEGWSLFGYSRSLDDRKRAQDPTARPLMDSELKKAHEEAANKGIWWRKSVSCACSAFVSYCLLVALCA